MLARYAFVNNPEVKYFESGNTLLKFSISVKRYNSKEKKSEGIAAYYDVEIWGEEAEALADQLKDGTRISIESATLSSGSYENKEGKRVYKPLLIFPTGIKVHLATNKEPEVEGKPVIEEIAF